MTIAIGSSAGNADEPTTHTTITSSPSESLVDRLPGLAIAAVASIGAGTVHAGAIGIHAEHVTLARLFIAAALFQLAFGIASLLRPARWLAAAGAVGNLVAVGVWLATRLTGISFISGLEVRETAQFADITCALLGLVAGGAALSAAIVGWHRGPDAGPTRGIALPSLVAAALTVPALLSGAGHVHNHTITTADGTTIVDESQPHVHGTDPATPAAAAATVTTTDASPPHVHNAAGAGTGDAGAASASVALDESQPHVHTPAAVPSVAYDPTQPIDLGGVAGVTPEQQARAENLVAITVIRLPQWSDPAVAEAAGFHSIGDGLTGFEHYIQWNWIDDNDYLDPDHPESLVYTALPDGTKQLVSAMYMMPDTVALADVPDVGGALTQWHIHDNLCFTKDPVAPHVAGLVDAHGGCPDFLQKFVPAPMIHVWITPNVCGPFAALEGVGAGQVLPGETRNCDHVHGSSATLG